MRLIDRYIAREVVSHGILGLAVFTFVFFVPQLVRLMDLVVRHTGSIWTVALLFLCTIPPGLAFTFPIGVLVGVLIGLGRLSADSEIVALHASGISLKRLLLPIGIVALVASGGTLATTFWLSPMALRTVARLQQQLLSSQAPFAVQPRVFDERFPKFVLYVQDVEAAATHWRGVFLASAAGAASDLIPESGDHSQQSSVTIAEEAQIVTSSAQHQIDLHLGSGSTHEYDQRTPDQYNVTTFGETDIPVDISGASSPSKNRALSVAEEPAGALLRDNGAGWRTSRVEFQRRIAFPAACLIFALLGVPMGVRPRRGGRAGGLILTLILVGGYYFLFVSGDHLAAQGRISPFLGVWAGNIVACILGLIMLARVENIRRPNAVLAWLESLWARTRRTAPEPASNGSAAAPRPAVGLRQALASTRAMAFPMLMDVYLLEQFFYYFFVLLAAFVVIFDAFTLFDLLGDIARNHVSALKVLSYFRYLVPLMVYQLAPLATLVATLVSLAVLAKNNEVIALKASGVSLYRLALPLLLAGLLVSGGLFLLDDTFLPYANQRQDALRNEIKGRPAQTYFEPARQWIFGENSKIYNYELFDSDRQLFGGLNVFELDPATFQMRRRIFATRATWEASENAWILTGGWVRDFGSNGRVIRYEPFKATTIAELTEPPGYFRREVRQSFQMNWRQLGEYIASLRQAGFDTARLSVQWHKKFAFPMIAAIIVFLGAPFAFLVGTRGAVGGLAVAVGIGVVYWSSAALLEAMGSAGQLPPLLAAWGPDAIFGFLGVYFFLKMPT
ncbi:MAG TPA: LptF/LptG family permease [Candidatus Acidoferrales bacterium]|jgi:LPS export ABC transporter permease LptG/LPS export ABC transporter permease LptF|nr:LptF/LptG family permease [Candidatus Acidoferrales bacterium]